MFFFLIFPYPFLSHRTAQFVSSSHKSNICRWIRSRRTHCCTPQHILSTPSSSSSQSFPSHLSDLSTLLACYSLSRVFKGEEAITKVERESEVVCQFCPLGGEAMVEAQTWTTRRGSNPRLETTEQVVDIPATPPGGVRNSGNAIGSFLSPNVLTALIIASWYLSNIGVLLLNKYLLSFYGYRYPIFLTMLHMLSCAGYSYAAINWLELVPLQHILSRRQFLKIFALSAIFCFSVVCGNTSLRYLPVSFNQAIGATTPFFTAIFAFLITCKKETGEVYLALLPVVFGIVLASNSEPLFHLFGFLICIGSTAGRALKSVVQGILLTSEAEKLHSMNLLLYMAPMAALILLPFTLYIEGNVAAFTVEKARGDSFIIFLLIGNATVAYLVNLTNFLVTKHTSALTLQVLGNAKAAVAAVVSVLIFRNPVTVMGMTGFAVTIMGVVLYSEAKKRSKVTTH